MTKMTLLDLAHDAMQAAPDNDTLRLKFYERVAGNELFLLLEEPPLDGDDDVTPQIAEWDGAQYVLVFDDEERLAAFANQTAPFVALSGRVIAGMLAGSGIGLAVNAGVAPSSILLPHDAVSWLCQTLDNPPDEVEARIEAVSPPQGLPETLITALDTTLATAMGLAQCAYLVGVTYAGGARGHLLGFVGALPQAQGALAKATAEALTFSGIEAGALDVGFFDASDPVAERLGRVGLRFDLPQPEEAVSRTPSAPGRDPENPPKLK